MITIFDITRTTGNNQDMYLVKGILKHGKEELDIALRRGLIPYGSFSLSITKEISPNHYKSKRVSRFPEFFMKDYHNRDLFLWLCQNAESLMNSMKNNYER